MTDILYKYRTFSEHAVPMLRRGTVWFALPASFNDPLDCKATILGEVTKEDGINFIKTIRVAQSMILLKRGLEQGTHPFGLERKGIKYFLKKFKKGRTLDARYRIFEELFRSLPVSFPLFDSSNFIKDIESALARVGVLSLSERCDHMLMWTHYTDNHRGFCLGFERSKTNLLGDERFCKSIRYVSEFPQLDLDSIKFQRTITPEVGAGRSENRIDLTDINLQNVIFSKSKAWSYEQE